MSSRREGPVVLLVDVVQIEWASGLLAGPAVRGRIADEVAFSSPAKLIVLRAIGV